MEYMAYAKCLREAADFFQKNHPELPDVVATYKKSADVIEFIMSNTDVVHVAHGRWVRCGTNPRDGADCSECGKHYSGSEWGDNYCKICGAKMDIKD